MTRMSDLRDRKRTPERPIDGEDDDADDADVGRMRRVLVGAALILVIALFAWLVGFSSVLGVRTIRVTGNHSLSAAEIRQSASIASGTPLLRLDKDSIRARVEALPEIRSVKVSTSYPSTVVITVSERVAVAYRPSASGFSLIDADDVAFRNVAKAPAGLPRIDSDSAAAVQVAAALPAKLALKVASIAVPTGESITLNLDDGRAILWGGTDRSSDKAKLLQALLGQPGHYFDLSDPDSVISR